MAEFVIRLNQSTNIRKDTLLSGLFYGIASYVMAFYLLPLFLEFSFLASSLLFCAAIFAFGLSLFKLSMFALYSSLDLLKNSLGLIAQTLSTFAKKQYLKNRIEYISQYLISRSIRI